MDREKQLRGLLKRMKGGDGLNGSLDGLQITHTANPQSEMCVLKIVLSAIIHRIVFAICPVLEHSLDRPVDCVLLPDLFSDRRVLPR